MLEVEAVRAPVIAHIYHAHTNYDARLACGFDRYEARTRVAETMDRALVQWERGA